MQERVRGADGFHKILWHSFHDKIIELGGCALYKHYTFILEKKVSKLWPGAKSGPQPIFIKFYWSTAPPVHLTQYAWLSS